MTPLGSAARRGWRRTLPLALGLILCVALAACGDLPRPFQPADKSTQAWTAPGDIAWGSIVVPPIEGLPALQSEALVQEVVDALNLRDVPASSHAGGRGSIVLAGNVAVVAGKLRWSLVTPDGATVLRFEEPTLGAQTSDATAPDLAAVAERAAVRVAAVLKPPAAAEPDRPPRLPLAIATVRGAPGDGGMALARAMRHSLARIGVTVADAPEDGRLTIQGWVRVAQDGAGADSATVTIAWDVLHPDGSRLGTVTQSNRVGEDQLTGSWGVLPRLVARAGAPGIAQLLDQPDVRRVAQLPQRKAPAKPPPTAPIEAPLSLAIQASGATPTATGETQPRLPIQAPLAVQIEASAAPLTPPAPSIVLSDVPPLPISTLLLVPRFKPRPELPRAHAVLVEAPIAVSITVR